MYFDPKNPPLETYPKKKILTSKYTDVCRRTVTAELLIMGEGKKLMSNEIN